jgi:hypothetical protein
VKKIVLVLAVLLISTPIMAGEALPSKKIFKPFIADITQPAFSVRLTGVVGSNRLAEINMGDEFGIYRWDLKSGNKMQFGIAGGVQGRFDISKITNDFQVADFSLLFPLDYVSDNWGARLMYWHTSSHVGDDYIISHGVLPTDLDKNVTDDIRLLGDYYFNNWLRVYGGMFYAFNQIPHKSERFHGQVGLEAEKKIENHSWFLAGNLYGHSKYGWQPSFNSRTGWKYYGKASNGLLFVEFFSGRLQYLAFNTQKETHWSFGFTLEM